MAQITAGLGPVLQDGHFEHVPYFSLPANELNDVIAPSCYSCFDYPNALADMVVRLPWPDLDPEYCCAKDDDGNHPRALMIPHSPQLPNPLLHAHTCAGGR